MAFCSLALSLFFVKAPPATQSPRVGVLRRPNAYIGLERIQYPSNATFPPIVNSLLSAFQINRRDSSRALSQDDRRYMSVEGTVVPEDHHIVATAQTNTIVQFRAMDWGMERCVLNIIVPDDTAVQLQKQGLLNIWKLEDTKELLPHISWDKAPARVEQLASIPMSRLNGTKTEFACASGSLPTFEIECSEDSPGCGIDWWQDKKRGAETGCYVVQYWTGNA